MHGWGFRAAIEPARVGEAVERLFAEHGLEAGKKKGGVSTYVVRDGKGGALVLCAGLEAGHALASRLCARLGAAGSLVELDLEDRDVGATGYTLKADGSLGETRDLDDAAGEICEEWFDDAPYRASSADALMAVLLGLSDVPGGGETRAWKLTRPLKLEPLEVREQGPAAPPPFRVFRHADGREWHIRAFGNRLELRIRVDEELVERQRSLANAPACAREAEAMIQEQLADGFVEAG